MAIKTFRPKTHSLRFKTVIDYKQEITTDEPYKPLLDRKNRINGRDNYGQLTVRHRGGGNKKHYRMIDFRRDKVGIPAEVETIEYDPNRSAFIALLSYADGEHRYILQPVGLKVGMKVVAGPEADILVGNARVDERLAKELHLANREHHRLKLGLVIVAARHEEGELVPA